MGAILKETSSFVWLETRRLFVGGECMRRVHDTPPLQPFCAVFSVSPVSLLPISLVSLPFVSLVSIKGEEMPMALFGRTMVAGDYSVVSLSLPGFLRLV
mmetsp:Transcript_22798/g.44281  ORF Transcript_22798/g.44281 Transcript_22798/m.44281 type:complete len:99 (+) Transcript_22798:391-687(+)